ncbi:MAG: hypothetical protein GJ680_18615 [Alteromonadaceae bacterium]|nr:hypothetical protein [Alteromonadaceae bacterium]
MPNITLSKFVFILIVLIVTIPGVLLSQAYVMQQHRITTLVDVYQRFGREYDLEEQNDLQIQHSNPVANILAQFLWVPGPKMGDLVSQKSFLFKNDVEGQCESIFEYTQILPTEFSAENYRNKSYCCEPYPTGFQPTLYDGVNDRVLIFCGVGNETHIVAASAETMNALFSSDFQSLDVRTMHD